jgi:serine protease
MKKIAVGIAVVLGFTLLQPVQAQASSPSIVIVDTAIDTSIPALQNKVVHEVCITESIAAVCPNGTTYQEGKGAATLPSKVALSKDFEHGTIMALIANKINPNANIIFIRVAGLQKNGRAGTFKTEGAIAKALEWTISNKTKYNIVSVSASVATSMASLNAGTNYCPIRPVHAGVISSIDKLISLGVPTIFPSGNNRDSKRIVFPACISQAVAVGGTGEDDSVSPFFNAGDLVDFYALAWYDTQVKRVAGTSGSAVAFSAFWAKNYKGDYQSTYNYIKSIAKTANGVVTTNSFVNVLG